MNLRTGLATFATASALLCGTRVVSAQSTPSAKAESSVERFGASKTIAISSDAAITVQNSSQSGVEGSSTRILAAPALDFFVIQNLSLGGQLSFLHSSSAGGFKTTSFGAGPRVGYNIAFTDVISIWPKVGATFSRTNLTSTVEATSTTPAVSSTTTSTVFTLNAFLPIMLHPAQHFFVGFGPFLDLDVTGENKTTTFGGKLTLGGWF